MPGRRAGSAVGKNNAESPKQGSKRLNFITKTIHFAHLVLLFMYLSMLYSYKSELIKESISVIDSQSVR